jgi:hypothetical protein
MHMLGLTKCVECFMERAIPSKSRSCSCGSLEALLAKVSMLASSTLLTSALSSKIWSIVRGTFLYISEGIRKKYKW